MILLDTTVLCYAVGTPHPLREPARDLLRAVREQRARATTTTEVLQEFVRVRARRRSREDALDLARAYAALLSPLAAIREDHVEPALRLFATVPALGAFDSLLAAVCVEASRTLVSADRAYVDVPGLRHVVPDVDGVAALLAAG